MSKIVVTDDFKIMTKRAFTAFKDKDEKSFVSAIRYIFRELKYNEQEQYIKYLFLKLESEVENE